jgi:ribonucleoside-diphosphate reductase beta chain
LKDTAQQVAYTAKEETIHALVGIKLVNVLREEYPELFDADLEDKILTEAEEAFKCECKIIDWILGDYSGDKLSKDILKEFIKERLNNSLKGIGFKPIFDNLNDDLLAQTEWFDEDVLGNTSTDFFVSEPVNYVKNHTSISEEDLF